MFDLEEDYRNMLKRLQDECGLDSIEDTAEYVLLHHNAFEEEFINYCLNILN